MLQRWTRAAALAVFLGCAPVVFSVIAGEAKENLRSGVDRTSVDAGVRAQDDLFRHVNGAWLKKTEIPADKSYYGSFISLRDRSDDAVRAIVEEARNKADALEGSELKKIGDLYASFMDEERVEKLGAAPIKPDLEQIAALKDRTELVKLIARFSREGVGGPFAAFISTDPKKSDQNIMLLSQGGLGLPDESFYRDPKFAPLRTAYVAHVEKMLGLAGVADPKAAAKTVMDFETSLAKGHWDRVKRRDATLTYNKKDRKALEALTPGFDWSAWFEGVGAPKVQEVIVREPGAFETMAQLVRETPLDTWKTYLTWRVVHEYAPVLSKPFEEETFNFYGKTLSGTPQNLPRWKRAVKGVEMAMGEAVGKLYVEKHFPPVARERMRELVKNLIAAYREDIVSLDWMSEETKAKALDKLAKFTPKIGHPETWRDYSGLKVSRDDLVGNIRNAAEFEHARDLAKLGKPVDRTEWHMTPQTVNAYYNPGMNEIVFPAAILQPPFFDPDADDAVNYGGIGAVIGHEIGHGFDDQGSKYDGDGNLQDWWTPADRTAFEGRTKALIAQYNEFSPAQLPGQHVNGALTIGENIGDLGGLSIALKAYRRSLDGKPAPVIDGLTGDQRFFHGWAQIWRSKYRDQELRQRLVIDPHSPTEFRCNGVVRNVPEFYEAFGVKQGDKLWLPEQRVRICGDRLLICSTL
ncbi:MAG: M13 family metallopeptidase [Isosphaeraceae bacterium]